MTANSLPPPPSEPLQDLPTIGHIGRYVLKFKVGQGGLGAVFAAYDPLLSRLIAIKTVKPRDEDGDHASFNTNFLHEARAAASLSHPHIVTVFDAGVSPQGAYIAMELLKGRDLRQMREEGTRPSIAQAALLVRRVADALSYAHGHGVVHCDIKPANIFMLSSTQPKVLDFGIARIMTPDSAGPGKLLGGGSPRYMAPEQLRGEAPDRRCDVYSLGVVLYELLTDHNPFARPTLEGIVDAVMHDDPRPAHEVAAAVPVALSSIVARAMAKDPARRYQSARVFSRDLRRWLDSHLEGSEGRDTGTDPIGLTRPGELTSAGPLGSLRDEAQTGPPVQGGSRFQPFGASNDRELGSTTFGGRVTSHRGWTVTGLVVVALVALAGLMSIGDFGLGPRPATQYIGPDGHPTADASVAALAAASAAAQAAASASRPPEATQTSEPSLDRSSQQAGEPTDMRERAADSPAPEPAPDPATPAASAGVADAPPTVKLSPRARDVPQDAEKPASTHQIIPSRNKATATPPSDPAPAPARVPSRPTPADDAPAQWNGDDSPGFSRRTARMAPVSTAVATRLGFVDLNVTPAAQVEIDGSPAGRAAPHLRLRMTEGSHVLTLRSDGYEPYQVRVQVAEQRPASISHRFEK